jgi:hypothetical protein
MATTDSGLSETILDCDLLKGFVTLQQPSLKQEKNHSA